MIYFFISLSTYICFLILKCSKGLSILEENKFNLKKYNTWVCNKKNFINSELLGVIPIIIAFNCNAKIAGISVIIFYLLISLLLIYKKNYKFKPKGRNIITIILLIIFYLLIFGLFYLDYQDLQDDFLIFDDSKFYYLILIILGYIIYYIILVLSFIINLFVKKNKKGRPKVKNI